MRGFARDPWWSESSAEDRATAAANEATRLRDQYHSHQQWHAAACLRFYDCSARSSLLSLAVPVLTEGASSYNVIQAVVDTFTSHVVKERIRPMFLTRRGSWKERRDAKAMGLAVESVLSESGLYGDEGTLVARDGCTVGTGVVKWVPDYANHRLLLERCLREELLIDPRDARLGHPRQMCHLQRIDRGVLAARFPDLEDEIDTAPSAPHDATEDGGAIGQPIVADQVEVAELWHLPSGYVDAAKDEAWGKKAKHDGRHVIVITGSGDGTAPTVLLDEPWPLECFPFAFFRPKRRSTGFDGRGFVEALKDAQLQINRMLRRVDGIMNLHSTLKVYINRQANIRSGTYTNDWSEIIEGDGPAEQAIRHIAPQSVSGDYIAQIERLISWCYQVVGLSELSVAAEKPKGIESGVGLRTLLDTESIRHTDVFRAWESFFLELSKGVVEGLRLLARNDPDFTLVWGDDRELREVKWSMVDLENARWRLRTWPINLLPSTPSAKMERVLELYKEQAISREQMLSLLDYPDLEAMAGDATAAERNIERMLIALEDDEDPTTYTPHGFLLLDLAESMGAERYNALEADGADPDVLVRLQRWLDGVREVKARIAPPPQTTGPAGAPPGAPPQPGAPVPPGLSLPAGPVGGPPMPGVA